MTGELKYDVCIIGGGLAGLSAAILLGRNGHRVVVVEKEKYPFHKVCGEYIGMESWNFLQRLGLPLEQMQPPRISKLNLTSPRGKSFTTPLAPGGFGLSRFLLDQQLAELAEMNGVEILQATKVTHVAFNEEEFTITTACSGGKGTIISKTCLSAYGKKSNLDVLLNRSFLDRKTTGLQNYVGVKYHVKGSWDAESIGLHNFENGYCGHSRIEDDRWCVCYLTTAGNLKNSGNSIQRMEKEILFSNPQIRRIFSEADVIENFPITIAQISFEKKQLVEAHMLMLGDAAGMITPLCGNGMSIALHCGKMAAEYCGQYLEGSVSRQQMEAAYVRSWQHHFSRRLSAGRMLQRFFGNTTLSNGFVGFFRVFPFMAAPVIRLTHGKSF